LTLLALTDTFSTKAFFQVRASAGVCPPPTPLFSLSPLKPNLRLSVTATVKKNFAADVERARRWHGLRQDSGDPFVFAPQAKEVYERLGINPSEKTVVYSDSLNVDKAIALKKQCDDVGLKRGLSSYPSQSVV
jgi:hypothetical protein